MSVRRKPGPVDPVVTALKQQRERLGLSCDRLAIRAGLSKTTLHHLEQGRLSSNLCTVRAIAEALGCDLYVAPKTAGEVD